MPETSRVPLVRCPKCDHLLPELPPYSTYCCGVCGAYLRAEKRASIDDGLSEKSWGERTGLGTERELAGEFIGFDHGSRIGRSPVRSKHGEEIIEGDLDLDGKFPTKRSVLGDFDAQSKSSGRSMDGDARNSLLRESSLGSLDGRGKSPAAMSVRGGVRKTPLRERMPEDFDEHRSSERDVSESEELEAREKVGAWFDNVKDEVGYANRVVTDKGAYNQWLHYEASADESETGGSRIQPRRTWRLDKYATDSGLSTRGEQVGRNSGQIIDAAESDYDDMHGRRRVLHDDWVRGGDHGLPWGRKDLSDPDGYGMEQLRAERNEFGGVRGNNMTSSVRQRFPTHPNDGASNFHSYDGYDHPRQSLERFSGSSSLQNVEMNRAELFRLYNDIKEQLSITGDLPENPTRRGHLSTTSADFYSEPDNYMHPEHFRSRRTAESMDLDEHVRMRPHHMNHRQVPGPFFNDHDIDNINSFPRSRLVADEFPPDDPSWSQYSRRPPHRAHYYPQRSAHHYVPRHSIDSTYDQHSNLRTHVQAHPASSYRRYLNPITDQASDIHDPYGQRVPDSRFPLTTPNISSRSQRSVDSKSDGGGSAQEHGKRIMVVKKNQLLCHPFAGAAPLVICYSCSQLLRLPKKLVAMKKTQLSLRCGSCHTTLSFNFDKKSHVSAQLQPKPNSNNVYDVPSKNSVSDHKSTLASTPAGFANRESYDFDVTGYTFQSTESEPSMQLPPSVSKEDLNVENSANKINASSHVIKSTGSPLQEHKDKGDAKETDVPVKDSFSSYVQNADAPTEMEINSDEIPVPDMTQSSEASSKNNGDGDKKEKSSSSGSIARGFQDLSPPSNTSNTKADVFVNGQPLPHRIVRKAEKLAGPVSPGQYWYDSRAGFWGVMGSYCLGIIPPFIQEFGFPMPVNCAGGDTGIYVNGRELHEKDLELLAKRGFPCTINKWYVVDISGIVQDEETGDTVSNLGRLAPSIERAKRGFGMQMPNMLED